MKEIIRIDTGAIYDKLTVKELQRKMPKIDVMEYLRNLIDPLDIDTSEEIVSYSTPYFGNLSAVLNVTDIRQAKRFSLMMI